MPFTLSHTLAVWPFLDKLQRWFCPVGLLLGSMVPDFHYILPIEVERHFTHSFAGILFWAVPIGVLFSVPIYLLYHPISYRGIRWLALILGLALGASTHNFWDAFTNGSGYFVKAFPELAKNCEHLGVKKACFRWINLYSTTIGLAGVLTLYLWKGTPRSLYWLKGALPVWVFLILASVFVNLLCHGAPAPKSWTMDHLTRWASPIFPSIALGVLIPLFLQGLWIWKNHRNQRANHDKTHIDR